MDEEFIARSEIRRKSAQWREVSWTLMARPWAVECMLLHLVLWQLLFVKRNESNNYFVFVGSDRKSIRVTGLYNKYFRVESTSHLKMWHETYSDAANVGRLQSSLNHANREHWFGAWWSFLQTAGFGQTFLKKTIYNQCWVVFILGRLCWTLTAYTFGVGQVF